MERKADALVAIFMEQISDVNSVKYGEIVNENINHKLLRGSRSSDPTHSGQDPKPIQQNGPNM
eukprot:3735467-Amphidinium_carterae.1